MTLSVDTRNVAIPDSVDLRDNLWPVENTGEIFAAPASAAATALEFHCYRIGEPPTDLSTLFIHYNARVIRGEDPKVNAGTSLLDAIKSIATHGACREATWPFGSDAFATKPPAAAYDEAKRFAAITCFRTDDPLEALALHYPVPFAARFPRRCLDEAGRTGILPDPTPEEQATPDAHPGHSMVLVGFIKATRRYIVRNCWGDTWGSHGHCSISFEAMAALCPPESRRMFVVAAPDASASLTSPTAVRPDIAAPALSSSGGLAEMAAKMREDIRSRLERDLTSSAKKVDDLLSRRTGTPEPPKAQWSCSMCYGTGSCQGCGGRGCGSCGNSGRCSGCNGRGTV